MLCVHTGSGVLLYAPGPVISSALNWLAAWKTAPWLAGSRMSGTTPTGVAMCSKRNPSPSVGVTIRARSSEREGVSHGPTYCRGKGEDWQRSSLFSMAKLAWLELKELVSSKPNSSANHAVLVDAAPRGMTACKEVALGCRGVGGGNEGAGSARRSPRWV